MTLHLSLAGYVFFQHSHFAFYSLQHHVHIRHRRDYDEQKAVVVVLARGPRIVGRDPKLGREIFHFGSRNNLNLHIKFTILIRQNKCNHLLFLYAKFHRILCKKIAAVNTSLETVIWL